MDEVLTIKVGDDVTLVKDTKAYKGTLQKDGGRFFIKLHNVEPGEPDEITIHTKA